MTDQPTSQSTNQPSDESQPTSPLTVETALWVAIGILALALRLARLDAAPLNAREAHEAVLAWRAASGQGMPQGDYYAPLLFAGNSLLFALCGTSDTLARLWPALFGTALTLAPVLFRQRVGRVGVLTAGLCLALSPTALVASRQLDGVVAVAAGVTFFLGGVLRFLETGRRRWLTLSAGSLALALTASPSVYGMLLTLSLAWLSLTWVWAAVGELRRLWESVRPHLAHVLVVCLLAGVALATALFWNPAGLGAAGGLLAAWVARFALVSGPAASPLTILVVYEPLPLLFGLGGLVWAIRHNRRLGALLGLWAGLAALLLILTPGRAPLDALAIVLPLALLTGMAAEAYVRSLHLREPGGWLSEGAYALVTVILWVHFCLRLVNYALSSAPTELLLALMTIVLQILLAGFFALTTARLDSVLQAIVMGIGIVLLGVTLSAGWGAAYVRPADSRELLVVKPTAMGIHDLVQTLRDLSWHRTGMPTTLPVTFESAPDSVLAWYLRDFGAAHRVESLEGLTAGDVVPVVVTARRDWTLPDGGEYAGQDFALRSDWSIQQVGCTWGWPPQCSAAAGWLFLRHTTTPPTFDQWAVLWLRQDVQDAAVSRP